MDAKCISNESCSGQLYVCTKKRSTCIPGQRDNYSVFMGWALNKVRVSTVQSDVNTLSHLVLDSQPVWLWRLCLAIELLATMMSSLELRRELHKKRSLLEGMFSLYKLSRLSLLIREIEFSPGSTLVDFFPISQCSSIHTLVRLLILI